MLKITTALTGILLLTGLNTTQAQNAHEESVKFMKAQQTAIVAEYEQSEEVVEQAFKERMTKAGLGKSKSQSGYMVWKGVSVPELSADKVDVYAMVDGKKDKSTVTMLVSKGYDNFVNSGSDAATSENMKSLLNSFGNDVRNYKMRLDLTAAEDLARMAESEYNKSVKENSDIQSDIARLEKKLAESKEAAAKRQQTMTSARMRVEELKKLNGQ